MTRARPTFSLSLLLLSAVLASTQSLSAQQDRRPGLAIFPLEGAEPLSIGIQQIMINHLAQNPAIRVVERTRLKELIAEIELGQSGKVSQETALRVGKIVNAKYVILGSYLEPSKDELSITTRIVNTETTETLFSRLVLGKRDKIMGLIANLGSQMEQGVQGLPPLSAEVREARRNQETLPAEAGFLYSQALAAADNGLKDVAINLYQQLTQKFPKFEPAKAALQQLRGT